MSVKEIGFTEDEWQDVGTLLNKKIVKAKTSIVRV